MIVGSTITGSVNPPLFAMGNNISLGLSDNRTSSALNFLNGNFELNEALLLAIMDLQVDEEGDIQNIVTCINDLSNIDEISGEESKEHNSWNVNTPLVHTVDVILGLEIFFL